MYPYLYREFRTNEISSNCITNHALGPVFGCSQLQDHYDQWFILTSMYNYTSILYLEPFLRSYPQQGSHATPSDTSMLQSKQTSSCVPCRLGRLRSISLLLLQTLTNTHKDCLPGQIWVPNRRSKAPLLAPMSKCHCRLRNSLVLHQDSQSMRISAIHYFPRVQTYCNSTGQYIVPLEAHSPAGSIWSNSLSNGS